LKQLARAWCSEKCREGRALVPPTSYPIFSQLCKVIGSVTDNLREESNDDGSRALFLTDDQVNKVTKALKARNLNFLDAKAILVRPVFESCMNINATL
jgi:hypothetical protein